MTNLAWMDGEILSNHADVTLVNNTAKTEIVTVPTGVRWYVFCGKVYNGDDVQRTCRVTVTDASDEVLMKCLDFAVGATDEAFFPNMDDVGANQLGGAGYPFPLAAGWKIKFSFAAGGASAGGTAEIVLIVLEVPA